MGCNHSIAMVISQLTPVSPVRTMFVIHFFLTLVEHPSDRVFCFSSSSERNEGISWSAFLPPARLRVVPLAAADLVHSGGLLMTQSDGFFRRVQAKLSDPSCNLGSILAISFHPVEGLEPGG